MEQPIGSNGLPRPIDSNAIPEKAYSPGQVAGAAFIGGPLGGSILLASNFALFGPPIGKGQTIFWGVLATAVVFALAFVLPENFPNTVLPAAYILAFQQIAQRYHGAEFRSYIESGGSRYSHWRVLGIGLLCLLALFAVLCAVIMVLPEEFLPQDPA
jgi:hypothetical protein